MGIQLEQLIPQDFCLQCKDCCRFSDEDSVWLPHDGRISTVASKEENNFLCTFLNTEDNKCSIYASRPFDCQFYPFLINRKDDKIFLAVDLNCPFVKEKKDSLEFKEYIKYLQDFLGSPEAKQILKNNPQIIQAYEDVLNLTVLSV